MRDATRIRQGGVGGTKGEVFVWEGRPMDQGGRSSSNTDGVLGRPDNTGGMRGVRGREGGRR